MPRELDGQSYDGMYEEFDLTNAVGSQGLPTLENNLKKSMKKWYLSKTIILAILTGAAGVVVAFETQYPGVGTLMIIKAVIDVGLRFVTTSAIE